MIIAILVETSPFSGSFEAAMAEIQATDMDIKLTKNGLKAEGEGEKDQISAVATSLAILWEEQEEAEQNRHKLEVRSVCEKHLSELVEACS